MLANIMMHVFQLISMFWFFLYFFKGENLFFLFINKELDTYFVLPTRMGLDCWWPNTLKKSGLLYIFSFH